MRTPLVPEFSPLYQQLIDTPATSESQLEVARAGAPLAAQPLWAIFAIDHARGVAQALLVDRFAPSSNTLFLLFPAEEGRFDVARARYGVGGETIEVAQSRHLVSIRITHPASTSPPLEVAQRLATTMLRSPDHRIVLRQLGTSGTTAYGSQDVDRVGRADPQWPHWVDTLLWWSATRESGFVAIKATGGPTKEVIMGTDDANKKWFDIP